MNPSTNKKLIFLSIIIPAYNEEKKIKRDILEASRFLKSSKLKGEIIISTDGVTDGTNEIVKDLKSKFKNLTLLSEEQKIGKGAAIKKAVKIANGKYIMFADAGYCVPFKFINAGLAVLEDGFDFALASRANRGSRIVRSQPVYRIVGSRIFGFIVRKILGVPSNIKDTQCGFKIYRNAVAKKLFSSLNTHGFMFDIEIILRAKKAGYKLKQFPVSWKNDADTKFNPFKGSIQVIRDLIKIKIIYRL